MKRRIVIALGIVPWLGLSLSVARSEEAAVPGGLLAGDFRWTVGPPVLAPLQRPGDLFYSIKDPSVVRFGGRWHLFCTIRGKERSHQVEYLSFEDWARTGEARRHLLTLHGGYF